MIKGPFKPPPLCDPKTVKVHTVVAAESHTVLVDGTTTLLTAKQLNERAVHTRQMVSELIKDRSEQFDISMYIWQNKITIDPLTRPRSHPELILDAEYSAAPEECFSNPSHWTRQLNMLRSVLVHEQTHLFVGPLNKRVNPRLGKLIWELKSIPRLRNIPIPETLVTRVGPEWARASTDLHILINWLEFQANKRFLDSTDRAQELISSIAAYEEIYQAVIECDESIAKIMRQPEHRQYLIEDFPD